METGTTPQPQYLTVGEVAKMYSLNKGTLYNWVHNDKIPHLHLNGALRFDRDELTQWAKAGGSKAA